MASEPASSKLWSAEWLVATLLATLLARRVAQTTWRLATGRNPPASPAHPDVSMSEAVAWAAMRGAAIGLARMMATRRAADYYRRTSGHLPTNLKDLEA